METSTRAKAASAESSEEQAPRFLPLRTIPVRLVAPPHTDRRPVFGIVSNMSRTGACIITNGSLPIGAEVDLEFDGRDPGPSRKAAARVVWCAERFEPIREIVGFLTGVCFQPEAQAPIGELLQSGIFQPVP